ncbi:MAG: hypothetical protein HQL25_07505 [Candidatus Omnitrophica bacterium]|nr:hypothetical protein [Candidatus Omnitrophota bacterium]
MKRFVKAKKETCFSPWLGFLVIIAVCVIIAGAIFVESNTHPRRHRVHAKPAPQPVTVQAAFPAQGGAPDAPDGKFVF